MNHNAKISWWVPGPWHREKMAPELRKIFRAGPIARILAAAIAAAIVITLLGKTYFDLSALNWVRYCRLVSIAIAAGFFACSIPMLALLISPQVQVSQKGICVSVTDPKHYKFTDIHDVAIVDGDPPVLVFYKGENKHEYAVKPSIKGELAEALELFASAAAQR